MPLEEINDNFELRAPKAIDDRYGPVSTGHTTPFSSIAAAKAAINVAYRYLGLTVLVNTGTENKEYWWKDGTADGDLVLKTLSAVDTWRTVISSSYGIVDIDAGGTGWGQFTGHTDFPGSEDTKTYVIGEDCDIQNLFISTSGTQPVTGTMVITVRKNGVDTALVITIPAGSSATTYSNTTDVVSIVAGDILTIRFVNNASSTALRIISSGISFIKA